MNRFCTEKIPNCIILKKKCGLHHVHRIGFLCLDTVPDIIKYAERIFLMLLNKYFTHIPAKLLFKSDVRPVILNYNEDKFLKFLKFPMMPDVFSTDCKCF